MTALIYKPTFPIPTQGDAGEVLTLNEAGTAYELEPAQGGASVAWDAVEEPAISLTTTVGPLKLVGHDTDAGVFITDASADGGSFNGIYWVNTTGVDGTQSFQVVVGASVIGFEANANGVGFNGAAPSIPAIPATPTEQDIADVLVALGLATQAAP